MREDEIEALCALHNARLIVHRDLAGTGYTATIIYPKNGVNLRGPFVGTSEQDRVTAVQQVWEKFDRYQRVVNQPK